MAWKTSETMIKSAKEWKEDKDLKLRVYESKYAKYAEMWEDKPDDRCLVHNTYHMIVDAINSVKAPINIYVLVALNKAINEDRKMMDEIIERFKGRDD